MTYKDWDATMSEDGAVSDDLGQNNVVCHPKYDRNLVVVVVSEESGW
jgi:hypothetical protein